MKGYFAIVIPTKSYIKAFVKHQLGESPIMVRGTAISNKFYDLLQHKTNERKTEYSNSRYNESLKVFVSYRLFRVRGCNLNETNIMYFNNYLEEEIKSRFYFLMDTYSAILPSFEANIPKVRMELGIDDDAWATDTMKKEYYRYRKSKGKALFYKKNSSRVVPSERVENITF